MNSRSILSTLTVTLLALPLLAVEPPVVDDFSRDKLAARRATRGPWTFENGVGACTQDDALFKKYHDHGPVIWYDVKFTDATIRFSYWADEPVEYFIFTINSGKKHAFRIKQSARPGVLKAFPREGEKNGMLTKQAPRLKRGEWVDVSVAFKGDTVAVKIGDWQHEGAHPAIAQGKTTIGLGFAFGTMKFRNFSVK